MTGPTGPPGLQGAKGETGVQGSSGQKGEPGETGTSGIDGTPVQKLTKNWKECAWKNLNDDRDNGLIKVHGLYIFQQIISGIGKPFLFLNAESLGLKSLKKYRIL